ncbi:MAG TPA: ABC transporter ATP-binding protein [Dehalococcoidia bacterium]|nr:ABC transporter ATP-binding protein [Dehalococcoidia bacterium]
MPDVIEVEGLRKTYGATVAVDDVSLEVQQGEIFGLVGPNGAGKTTAVECLQGLRHPDAGLVRVLGADPRDPALRGRIGSQLQSSALPDRIRVWEAIDLFASFGARSRDWRQLLEEWGLADRANAYFSALSGGQRQRLFIALALVTAPEVVFLDEMTAGLDPSARRLAWHLVERVRDSGVTVVIVTHFMEEAEQLCDRIAVIDRGRVSALGSPQQLMAQYAPDIRVSFTIPAADLDWLRATPDVASVAVNGHRVEVRGNNALIVRVAAALADHGLAPADFRVHQPTLEDVFLRITGAPE